jgi:hypothetical protein
MPKVEEIVVNEGDLLDYAIDYAESHRFEQAVERFQEKHWDLFLRYMELCDNEKSGEPPEQSHELFEAYNEYQLLIEDLFDDFVQTHRVTKREFFDSFRSVAEGHCTALFEEHRNQWFVDMLISWTEYEEFVRRMCDVVRKRPGRVFK